MATFFGLLLSFTALLLIVVVLIQRGRGGGLAGALGGGGGQSAFGSKAGDLFTRITFGLATFWILLCIVTLRTLSASSSKFSGNATGEQSATDNPGESTATPASGVTPSTGSTSAEKSTPAPATTPAKTPPAPPEKK